MIFIIGCLQAFGQQAQQGPSAAEIAGQLRQGNHEGALSLANKALAGRPYDCQLLSLKALAYNGMTRYAAALQSFEEALTQCPAYLPALEGAAEISFSQSNPTAPSLLHRILSLQPDNTLAHAMLASILRKEGKCKEARSHFEASRSLFASHSQLQQDFAFCLIQTGELKAAQEECSQLLATHPGDANLYQVALLQWQAHAPDDALTTLAPLLSSKQYEPALTLASRIYEDKGDTPHAVDLLRTAIVLSPDNVDRYLDFADIAFVHKSFQVGIDMLNAGLKRLPSSAPLYLARGVLEVQISRFDEAVSDFEQAHHLDPRLSFADDAIGLMQSQQHHDAAALSFYRQKSKLHPEDAFLLYLLAEQLSQGADEAKGSSQAEAIAAAKQSVMLDPHYRPAHDLLAVLYLRANEPDLAIQQAELALAEDSDDKVALYQEIMARRKMGDTEAVRALAAKLGALQKEDGRKEQAGDRFRLQDGITH